MKVTHQYISKIFQDTLNKTSVNVDESEISQLLFACMETNRTLWQLEDVSRMHDLGFENVAKAKMEIDLVNQKRNETISQLDLLLDKELGNVPVQSLENFYSESPGMLIDRMAILFLRHHFISQLLNLITDEELRSEYLEKEKQLSQNLNDLGAFLDFFFYRISKGEVFFKIHKPLKIYNDDRVKKHIRNLFTNIGINHKE